MGFRLSELGSGPPQPPKHCAQPGAAMAWLWAAWLAGLLGSTCHQKLCNQKTCLDTELQWSSSTIHSAICILEHKCWSQGLPLYVGLGPVQW